MNKEATRSESRPCPICTGECCHTGNWIGETFKPLPQDEVEALRSVGAPGFEEAAQDKGGSL